MQIMNSTSYCYDRAIFSCVNEDRSFLWWRLRNERRLYYSRAFTILSSTSSTSPHRQSNITVEITYGNSSFIATTLTITNISLLGPVTVECDGETREEFHYNMDPGKLTFSFSSKLALLMNCDFAIESC